MSVDARIFTQCDHFTGGKQYIVERCPKCGGKGYYYDISYDLQGHANLITGTMKLQQEMLKIINDVKGNNPFYLRWGCELHGLIGTKQDKLTGSKLQLMVRMSLEYLRHLQLAQQEEYKNMSNDEILLGVESMDVKNYLVGYDIDVTIKNTSNEILNQSILL
jgi:hypothetical protein